MAPLTTVTSEKPVLPCADAWTIARITELAENRSPLRPPEEAVANAIDAAKMRLIRGTTT
jgi:hypothetical protein